MKNNRKIFVSIGVILSAMALLIIFAFRQEAQTNNANRQDEPPTIVKRGQPSEKEKAYSKKYAKYSKPRINIGEAVKQAEQQGYNGVIERNIIVDTINIAGFSTPKFFQLLNCSSDTIVFGSTMSKTAHLTEDETFVFTEYDFKINEILKNNSPNQLEKGKDIQVTRPGGYVRLENHDLRISDDSIQQLKKNKDYLLFLRYVPEANGYVLANRFGDFIFEGNRFHSISNARIPEGVKRENDLPVMFSNILNSIRNGCPAGTGGGN